MSEASSGQGDEMVSGTPPTSPSGSLILRAANRAARSRSPSSQRLSEAATLDDALVDAMFDPDNSAAAIDRARRTVWKDAEAVRNKIKALLGQNEFDAALKTAVQASLTSPHNSDLLSLLARAALEADSPELAASASARALMLDPGDARAAGLRAEALYRLGSPDDAEAYLLASICNSGEDAESVTDAVFRCATFLEDGGVAGPGAFAEVGQAARKLGARTKAVAAFTKGAGWSRRRDVLRTLLSLCENVEGAPTGIKHHGPPPSLLLISQIQRSGGSLIAQLFDGHAEVYAHPHELHIGRPEKWHWPDIDLDQPPLQMLANLFEIPFLKFIVRGYSKGDGNKAAAGDLRRFSFCLETLVADFKRRAELAATPRDILDAYFLAFFSSWGEYAPTGKERWVSAFCPRMAAEAKSMEAFYTHYPDGKLISCVRDPVSWYASSLRHDKEYEDLDHALELWRTSTEAAIRLAETKPQAIRIITFEGLVGATHETMDALADWLAIKRSPRLCVPTYAGQAVKPNSSFSVDTYGVHKASPRATELPAASVAKIESEARELYRAAASVAAAQATQNADSEVPRMAAPEGAG